MSVTLLEVLDALARNDCGPAGFQGSLAVGVRTEPPAWWRVQCGRQAEGRFVDRMPEDVDAWIAMGPAEAEAVIGRRPMPDRPAVITAGNRRVLARFIARYVRSMSMVALRAGSKR